MELNRKLRGKIVTVVSSDSATVKKYCVNNNILFVKRNPVLASDVARIEDVIYDAYLKIGGQFDYISLLYGNVPTRYPQEFLKAYDFLKKNEDYDAVISVQKVEKYNPSWMFELDEEILPAKKCAEYRRQDLRQYMIHDGHTILFRGKHFLEFMNGESLEKKKGLYDAFGKRIKPMLNDRLIVDVDAKKDLEVADAIMFYRKGGNYEIL
jgi:CMP-N-acetylneuraminic acid synthetase